MDNYSHVFNFFIAEYGVDLNDIQYYFIPLSDGRTGYYDAVADCIVINRDCNSITKEIALVHECAHRMIDLMGWNIDLSLEEGFCKYVESLYITHEFGTTGLCLLRKGGLI